MSRTEEIVHDFRNGEFDSKFERVKRNGFTEGRHRQRRPQETDCDAIVFSTIHSLFEYSCFFPTKPPLFDQKGDIVDGVMSDIPLRKANMEVDLNASLSHSHQPPLPPPPNQNTSAPPAELGSYVTTTTADQKSVSSTNGSQDTTLECEEISVARDVEGGGRNSTSDEEESVEHLLSSLIGALNTDNGRADFDRLTGTTVAPA